MTDHVQVFSSGARHWHVHAGGKALRVRRGPDSTGRERRVRQAVALPFGARLYVGAVCAAGAGALITAAMGSATARPMTVAILLAVSLVASAAKVEIAVLGSGATLTACHIIDLLALLLCGTDAAVLVAAWGGWTQCAFRSRRPNPLHQTAFSVAALALAMILAGFVYTHLGGPSPEQPSLNVEAFAVAGTAFFLVNSGLVAAAVSLSVGESFPRVWFDFFLSVWPSYLIGAGLSAVLAVGLEGRKYWLVPLLAASLLVLHRNYRSCLARMNDGITDPLTGLPNKRFALDFVEHELRHVRRGGGYLAIALLDMNGFKRINDKFGHAAGDRVLRHVGDRLANVLRESDLCARYGGDEFLLVMPDCSGADALHRVQDMQTAVAMGETEFGADLSLSAGIAVFPDDGACFDALFVTADARMYRSKVKRVQIR